MMICLPNKRPPNERGEPSPIPELSSTPLLFERTKLSISGLVKINLEKNSLPSEPNR